MKKSINVPFVNYVKGFGNIKTMALFGSVGIFCDDAIFALLVEDKIYLSGGEGFDQTLIDLGCSRYQHKKKYSSSLINYYEITELFNNNSSLIVHLINTSIQLSLQRKSQKRIQRSKRLRDLPNLHLTLERMMKKVGITKVETFFVCGAEETYKHLQDHYGQVVDINVLWKLVGAIESCHWSQIPEEKQQQVLMNVEPTSLQVEE